MKETGTVKNIAKRKELLNRLKDKLETAYHLNRGNGKLSG